MGHSRYYLCAMAVQYVPWNPETEEDRAQVRTALAEVVESQQFRNSKRYPAMLSYLVEEVLAGHLEIKERTLGIEVFGRPADYDTNTDTAVRYTASEIRKRLALFYHAHPDSSLQIALSTRSYVPEFLRQTEVESGQPGSLPPEAEVPPSPVPTQARDWRKIAFSLAAVLVFIVLTVSAVILWRVFRPDPVRAFWEPYLGPDTTVLICPGSNFVDAAKPENMIQPADATTTAPYLSFGNGLALGRMTAAISRMDGHYRVEAAGQTPLSRLSEDPIILIGAYNNQWTQRLLLPLRFHFSPAPQKGIVDSKQANREWKRTEEDIENSPDYALVARFRSESTGNMVVVAAGLKRFGTDAASQFVSSAEDLKQLDALLGRDWRKRNIEVVLKVDVAAGRVGAPQIQDAYAW